MHNGHMLSYSERVVVASALNDLNPSGIPFSPKRATDANLYHFDISIIKLALRFIMDKEPSIDKTTTINQILTGLKTLESEKVLV